jgi:hypothetical protein
MIEYSDEELKMQIIVLDRGHVLIGYAPLLEKTMFWFPIKNSRIITKWGTTRGLSQLIKGKTPDTILADVSQYETIPTRAVIRSIPIPEEYCHLWTNDLIPEKPFELNVKNDSQIRIIVLDRGHVLIAQMKNPIETSFWFTAKNARIITRWGTTRGLSQLTHGITVNTILADPAPCEIIPSRACLRILECDQSAWKDILHQNDSDGIMQDN